MLTRWSQDTLDWICCNKNLIRAIASALGVPAEAIAGAMAKENDWYRHGPEPWVQWGADQYAYACTFNYSHWDWRQESLITRDWGKSRWEKGKLPSLIDCGPANFQIATAIRLLELYQPNMRLYGDKLGLEPYVNDYNELVRTLTRGDYNCGGEGVRLSAALYGLMVAEALAFFEAKADQSYWNSLSQVKRDAIIVTYCSMGKRRVEDGWKQQTAWTPETGPQLPYEPKPGPDPAGGQSHEYNACLIGKALLNLNYDPSDPECKLPDCKYLDPEDCKIKQLDPCLPPPPNPPGPLPRRDPLLIDLNGDGILTTNVNGNAYFDHDVNGFREQTAWVDSNDGLLAIDRNENGLIDDGRELFSDQTILKSGVKAANGFQALADLDTNKDGKIDASDEQFANLRVWRDFDGDGFSFPHELFTLDQLGIKSIHLDSTITNIVDQQGNTRTRAASFEKTDGALGQIAEYNLQSDPVNSMPVELLPVSEEVAALPNIFGYGNVHELHQSMMRDESGALKDLVHQFMNATDISSRNSLMDQILFKWTGSANLDPNSRGGGIDARKVGVIEKFYGRTFAGVTGANLTHEWIMALNETYRQVYERMYAQLMGQTHLMEEQGMILWMEERAVTRTFSIEAGVKE